MEYALNNRGDKLEGTYAYDGDIDLHGDIWDDYESYEVDNHEFQELFNDLSDGNKMISIYYGDLRYSINED